MQQEDSEEDDKTQRIARSSSVHAPRLPVFPGMDHAVLKVSGAPGSCRCSPAPGRGILLRAAVPCGGWWVEKPHSTLLASHCRLETGRDWGKKELLGLLRFWRDPWIPSLSSPMDFSGFMNLSDWVCIPTPV